MRVLVTRPVREGLRWVQQLRERGIGADCLPLIEIAPPADEEPVRQAWERLEQFQAVMFVSGNAVAHFFETNQAVARTGWTSDAIKTRAWAPGPGTREALLQAGVDAALIDSPADDAQQFDSQALWQQVGGQLRAGERVLVVRGGDASGAAGAGVGRDWLAAQLAQRGVVVETVVAYRRRRPAWTPQQAQQAQLAEQAAADASIWLFSSSEAIANLQALLPAQQWGGARAIATHPRIAQAARDAGFGVVCLSRPTLDAVVASIESLR
jgi:uroporphyrinogen-III synthase